MLRLLLAALLGSTLVTASGCVPLITSPESESSSRSTESPASGENGKRLAHGPSAENVSLAGYPDLRAEGISSRATCGSDGKCSVVLYVTVANRGTASSGSFVVGGRGWGSGTISTCTGMWQATNTTSGLMPSQSRTITLYGPGYVGPRVNRGSVLSITALADAYCAVREVYESNNSRMQSVRVGY